MSIARDQCRMGNPTPTTSHLMATPAAAGFRAGMAEAVAAAA